MASALSDHQGFRLYGEFSKVEDQPDGTIVVHGIASSESVDSDGEVITSEAMKAALPGYMKFPAIREMHQPKAAGTALSVHVGRDGLTHLEAHIVDKEAVLKVRTKVYRGFSVGGRVPAGGRDEKNPLKIKAVELVEISLVDRPANPDAVIQVWKADAIDKGGEDQPRDADGRFAGGGSPGGREGVHGRESRMAGTEPAEAGRNAARASSSKEHEEAADYHARQRIRAEDAAEASDMAGAGKHYDRAASHEAAERAHLEARHWAERVERQEAKGKPAGPAAKHRDKARAEAQRISREINAGRNPGSRSRKKSEETDMSKTTKGAEAQPTEDQQPSGAAAEQGNAVAGDSGHREPDGDEGKPESAGGGDEHDGGEPQGDDGEAGGSATAGDGTAEGEAKKADGDACAECGGAIVDGKCSKCGTPEAGETVQTAAKGQLGFEVIALRADLLKARAALRKSEEKLAAATARASAAETKIAKAQALAETGSESLAKIRSERDVVHGEMEKAAAERDSLRDRLQKAQTERDEAAASASALRAERDALDHDLARASGDRTSTQERLSKVQQERDSAEDEIAKLRGARDSAESRLEKMAAEKAVTETRLTKVMAERDSANADVHKARIERDQADDRAEKLAAELDVAGQRVTKLSSEVRAQADLVVKLQARAEQAESIASKAAADAASNAERVAKLSRDNAAYETANSRLIAEVESTKVIASQREVESATNARKAAKLAAERDAVTKEFDIAKAEIARLSGIETTLRKANAKITAERDAAAAERDAANKLLRDRPKGALKSVAVEKGDDVEGEGPAKPPADLSPRDLIKSAHQKPLPMLQPVKKL